MRGIDFIVVHHTDSPDTTTVEDVDEWHKARGWSGIGYHFLIHRVGLDWVCSQGRPVEETGAHDHMANTGSIGVAVAGRYTEDALSKSAQDCLVDVLAPLCLEHGLRAGDVYGHSEQAPGEPDRDTTKCPGFSMTPIRYQIAGRLGVRLECEQ